MGTLGVIGRSEAVLGTLARTHDPTICALLVLAVVEGILKIPELADALHQGRPVPVIETPNIKGMEEDIKIPDTREEQKELLYANIAYCSAFTACDLQLMRKVLSFRERKSNVCPNDMGEIVSIARTLPPDIQKRLRLIAELLTRLPEESEALLKELNELEETIRTATNACTPTLEAIRDFLCVGKPIQGASSGLVMETDSHTHAPITVTTNVVVTTESPVDDTRSEPYPSPVEFAKDYLRATGLRFSPAPSALAKTNR